VDQVLDAFPGVQKLLVVDDDAVLLGVVLVGQGGRQLPVFFALDLVFVDDHEDALVLDLPPLHALHRVDDGVEAVALSQGGLQLLVDLVALVGEGLEQLGLVLRLAHQLALLPPEHDQPFFVLAAVDFHLSFFVQRTLVVVVQLVVGVDHGPPFVEPAALELILVGLQFLLGFLFAHGLELFLQILHVDFIDDFHFRVDPVGVVGDLLENLVERVDLLGELFELLVVDLVVGDDFVELDDVFLETVLLHLEDFDDVHGLHAVHHHVLHVFVELCDGVVEAVDDQFLFDFQFAFLRVEDLAGSLVVRSRPVFEFSFLKDHF